MFYKEISRPAGHGRRRKEGVGRYQRRVKSDEKYGKRKKSGLQKRDFLLSIKKNFDLIMLYM